MLPLKGMMIAKEKQWSNAKSDVKKITDKYDGITIYTKNVIS